MFERGRRGRGMLRLLLALVLTLLAIVVGALIIMQHHGVNLRILLSKLEPRLGYDLTALVNRYSPAVPLVTKGLKAQPKSTHPRLFLTRLSGLDDTARQQFMRRRARAYTDIGVKRFQPCGPTGMHAKAVCWVVSGNREARDQAIASLRKLPFSKPKVGGHYGNGWSLALTYDLLAGSGALSEADRAAINPDLHMVLRTYLDVLARPEPSLWHGRANLISQALLLAVAMDGATPEVRADQRRALAHFHDLIRALELTPAWPEGYNYWINSRGWLIAMAGNAYLNGLALPEHADRLREVLRKVGYWHLYAMRPDGRVQAIGDEGPRVDLKYETRRVIDLLAMATRDPVLASYSRYLQQLHGAASYHSRWQWGFWLFNDPSIEPKYHDPERGLVGLKEVLPSHARFGVNGMEQVYVRSGWGRDDTFISFRAGHGFSHHGHADAGHFSLFKGAPLATSGGTYPGVLSPHRLNYSMRTVAKNSLLILRPGETVAPNKHFTSNIAAGGQRLTQPTGSAIRSTAHWASNLSKGLHLEGGRIVDYQPLPDGGLYIKADLTSAYNNTRHDSGGYGGKVKYVRRELLYLQAQDRLIIRDQVSATGKYAIKWLLHTMDKPELENPRLLVGAADDGILEATGQVARVRTGRGRLVLQRFHPGDGRWRILGGPNYRYYVEADGDDSDLDGVNMDQGADRKPWFDDPQWRIELQRPQASAWSEFLVVMSPSLDEYRAADAEPLLDQARRPRGVLVDGLAVIFMPDLSLGASSISLPASCREILLVDVEGAVQVQGLETPGEFSPDSGGLLRFKGFKPHARTLRLASRSSL